MRQLPEHKVRKAARETAEIGLPQLKALLEHIDVDAALERGHQQALLSTGPAPQLLQGPYDSLPFSVQTFKGGGLVLGDSVLVVNTLPRHAWAPFFEKGQTVITVAVPLASDRLLIGGRDPGLPVASWNEAFVQCSREQFQAAVRTPEFLRLVDRIGASADLPSANNMDKLFEESFNDSMLNLMGFRLDAVRRGA